MRLTVKITFAVLLGVALVFSAYSYFSIQREREQLKKNLSRESRHIGESLRFLVTELWQQRGEEVAIAFLKRANQDYQQTLVRWVWIEGDPLPQYQPRVPVEQLGELFHEETVALLAGSPDGKDFLLTYLPLITADGRVGAIELSESMDEMHDYVQESLRRSAVVVGVSVISGVLFMGVLGSIWIDRPMQKLRAQAERIGTGDLSTSINLPGSGEISELSSTIERMRGQLAEAREAEQIATNEKFEALEKLRHTERLATLGQLSAGIAHELGTPLNVISGRAKMIGRAGMKTDDIFRSAGIIGEQAERMTEIIRQLLSFARRGEAKKQTVDLNTLLRSIQSLLEPTAREHGVELLVDNAEQSQPVFADPGQLQQVVLNLTLNGIQAMSSGGHVTLSSFTTSNVVPPDTLATKQTHWACLQVKDQGKGMDAETLKKIFDPFFTTKDIGQGTGLGLSIAHGIIEEHGGWIAVDSIPEQGSCFSIYLPDPSEGEHA
ncbi:Signal transduction histidine kinase [Desulfuromusa kysingii]|uniref:histidine kinase n=1 Tax=Desulfuromusa kysingii TaxID=37625 RepID=A0A1H4AY39_9BACT|nr:HAMP domain-containing sensor histidine kinase [Desulfuromusa kysingii]SEA40737.1 Signal transduction histidine kinase [Desulfuromusa kysingii]